MIERAGYSDRVREEFARALGANEGTTRRYLNILTDTLMVRAPPLWFENVKKRQVKAPKIYVRDTGLLHTLPGLPRYADVAGHPKAGAAFDGGRVSADEITAARTVGA